MGSEMCIRDRVWTPEMMVEHQSQDAVLSVVRRWLLDGNGKPKWDDIAHYNSLVKFFWGRYEMLRINPKTLDKYRRD